MASQKPSNWSLNPQTWNVPLPQSVQDFGDIAGQRASSGFMLPAETWTGESPDVATAKARLDAAKERLGPKLSTVADTLGYYASPTNLINGIPVVGGALRRCKRSSRATTKATMCRQSASMSGRVRSLEQAERFPAPPSCRRLSAGCRFGHVRTRRCGVASYSAIPWYLIVALAGYLTHNAATRRQMG
jgi:hypothetical protein